MEDGTIKEFNFEPEWGLASYTTHKANEGKGPGFAALNVRLCVHADALSILWEFWRWVWESAKAAPKPKEVSEFLALEVGGSDSEGYAVSSTISDHLEGLGVSGIWAFANSVNGTVHLWFMDGIPISTIRHILSHELGHIACTAYLPASVFEEETENCIEQTVEQMPPPSGVPADEFFADLFGWVARQVEVWIAEIMNPEKQGKKFLPLSKYLQRYVHKTADATEAIAMHPKKLECVIAQVAAMEEMIDAKPETTEINNPLHVSNLVDLPVARQGIWIDVNVVSELPVVEQLSPLLETEMQVATGIDPSNAFVDVDGQFAKPAELKLLLQPGAWEMYEDATDDDPYKIKIYRHNLGNGTHTHIIQIGNEMTIDLCRDDLDVQAANSGEKDALAKFFEIFKDTLRVQPNAIELLCKYNVLPNVTFTMGHMLVPTLMQACTVVRDEQRHFTPLQPGTTVRNKNPYQGEPAYTIIEYEKPFYRCHKAGKPGDTLQLYGPAIDEHYEILWGDDCLTFEEYTTHALSTAIYPQRGSNPYYPVLGLCGEVGEIAEKVKKVIRDHNGVMTPDARAAIAVEVGDAQWYLAAVADELQIPLHLICIGNIAKLQSRKERDKLKGSGDNR